MTTTNEHNWQPYGYRVIPDFPHYVISTDLDVWSLPREVRCKGGKTRLTLSKRLKPEDGRVTLCHNGRKRRFHVERELFPQVFIRPRRQAWCLKNHPLMEPRADLPTILAARIGKPKIAEWGTGNRVCLRCHQLPGAFDKGSYSLEYGVAGMPDYTSTPQPKLNPATNTRLLAELEYGEGFTIGSSPIYALVD
jgi:hypothetical protein